MIIARAPLVSLLTYRPEEVREGFGMQRPTVVAFQYITHDFIPR
jgi:hypothetical protein